MPVVALSRVTRAEVFAMGAEELEYYVNSKAGENICLEVSAARPALASEDTDWAGSVPSRESERERISRDLALSLPQPLVGKAYLLVEALDDFGFLDETEEAIAARLGIPRPAAQRMLDVLKLISPTGLGSGNLRSFMLFQLEEAPQGSARDLAERWVKDSFETLTRLNLRQAAKSLRCTFEDLVEAYTGIISNLRPYPLLLGEDAPQQKSPCAEFNLAPDGTLEWGFIDEPRISVRILPFQTFLPEDRSNETGEYRRVLMSHHFKARALVRALNDRTQAFARLFEDLLLREDAFLRGGARYPDGITNAACATRLGISASLLSRLSNANAVVLPSGEILSLRKFFEPQGALKNAIWEALNSEEDAHTQSDTALVERLAERGNYVSRRTVCKYRLKLGIENSYLRRKRAEIASFLANKGE